MSVAKELVPDPTERGFRILAEMLLEAAAAEDPRGRLRVIDGDRAGDREEGDRG